MDLKITLAQFENYMVNWYHSALVLNTIADKYPEIYKECLTSGLSSCQDAYSIEGIKKILSGLAETIKQIQEIKNAGADKENESNISSAEENN